MKSIVDVSIKRMLPNSRIRSANLIFSMAHKTKIVLCSSDGNQEVAIASSYNLEGAKLNCLRQLKHKLLFYHS